jgi:hypothetical protein
LEGSQALPLLGMNSVETLEPCREHKFKEFRCGVRDFCGDYLATGLHTKIFFKMNANL